MHADVAAARDRDPAAQDVSASRSSSAGRGVQALLAHRVAHALREAGVPIVPRVIAYLTRAVTGVEIHPAASIGREFFIDHGAGVVIGETAEIGERVTLYQGVTLGGTGFQRGKRHPTLGDNVTVGSGAKLLGPIVVGDGAKIGANTVVVEDVPPGSTVVGNPGHPVKVDGRRVEGPDADWIHLPDPIAEAIKTLSSGSPSSSGGWPSSTAASPATAAGRASCAREPVVRQPVAEVACRGLSLVPPERNALPKRHLLVPCLLLVSALALAACGSGSGDQSQIEEAIETSATITDPADCTTVQTQNFNRTVHPGKRQGGFEGV